MPIETRGVLAYVDDSGTLIVVSSTQHPYQVREAIAEVLGLVEERLRVIAPEVGGSFGAKGQVYPEEILGPARALRLGRPVRWAEAGNEHSVPPAQDGNQLLGIGVGSNNTGRL